MLSEDLTTEGSSEFVHAPWSIVHFRVDYIVVFDHDSDFGIVVTELRAVIQVCGTANYDTVIGDEELQPSLAIRFTSNTLELTLEWMYNSSVTKASISGILPASQGTFRISSPLSI